MSTVVLRHGGEANKGAVTAIMLNLEFCMDRNPIALYELVQVCQDASHVPFGNTGAVLAERSLLDNNGQPHDLVRDVVLSAVRGDGMGLHLGSPFAGDES